MSTTISSTATRDRIAADARSFQDFISGARQMDPALAASLTEKPLVMSKTVWGTLTTMVVSYAATRYGFDWDDQTCALVSGLCVMGATAALRFVTRSPISGVVQTKA